MEALLHAAFESCVTRHESALRVYYLMLYVCPCYGPVLTTNRRWC